MKQQLKIEKKNIYFDFFRKINLNL